MLGTRTFCKGGVVIRWLGPLGRCGWPAIMLHCLCTLWSRSWQCTFGYNAILLIARLMIHYIDVNVVVLSCNCHSSFSRVLLCPVDPARNHASHHLVSEPVPHWSPPPPEIGIFEIQERSPAPRGCLARKCDLRHAGRHTGSQRVTRREDRPPGA